MKTAWEVFSFSDQVWEKINRRLELPDLARTDIELVVHAYRGERALWKKTPGMVAKRLRTTSAAAAKLARLLESLEEQDRIEIVEACSSAHRPLFGEKNVVTATISQARAIATICGDAAAQVSKIDRWDLLDRMIERLAGVLQKHSATAKISRGKVMIDFLTAICRIADKTFGRGSVDEAVRRASERKRGKSRKIFKKGHRRTASVN